MLLSGNVNEHGVATVFLRHQTVFGELTTDLLRVSAFLIDLVNRYHDRHVSTLGVVKGLNGLGHHTVVGGNHQDGDVSYPSTTRTHGGEGLVTRRINEGDGAHLAVVLNSHLVGTNVLGNTASLRVHHVSGTDGVQQLGLTVVDVTHNGYHRRTYNQLRFIVFSFFSFKVDVEGL